MENIIIDKVLGIPLKNEIGAFSIGAYKMVNKHNVVEEIILLYYGDITAVKNVRINSACYTSDLFHCGRCDCHDQLEGAMKYFVGTSKNSCIRHSTSLFSSYFTKFLAVG